jgi:N-acetylmuramoyl-L-alanine amidase
MQTFYRDSEAGPIQSSSVALATAIHSYCLFKLRTVDLGIRSSKLTILTGQKQRPAILIECGFLSNPGEAAKIDSPDYRQSIAEAIASGVESYLKATSLKATNSFVPLRQ